MEEGAILLTFWANDTLGKLGSKDVAIKKQISGNGGGSGTCKEQLEGTNVEDIPYNFVFLIFVVTLGTGGVICAIYLLKRGLHLSSTKNVGKSDLV